MGGGADSADSGPLLLARAVLQFEAGTLAEDITIRLRRQVAPEQLDANREVARSAHPKRPRLTGCPH